jgi:UDP:flavonoid glycosyltransferase YjiC (YdhE family)
MLSSHSCHLVFLNIKATGHVNPTLSIVSELRSRGCKITYFVDAELRRYVEAAGATWRPFRAQGNSSTGNLRQLDEAGIEQYVPSGTPPERYSGLPHIAARDAELFLPGLLEDLAAMNPKPATIVYDPFISFARVAAYVLRVPAVATLTMPGPATMAKPKSVQEAWEAEPWVDGPRCAVMDTYGFDIFEQGMPMEFYSPLLNLVTTIDELFMPPAAGHQQERFGSFPFEMVGVLADSSVKRIANANVSIGAGTEDTEAEAVMLAVGQAIQEGRQVVYISLGTVATSDYFYQTPFGQFGRDNGLSDVTGRQLAQHVFRNCFEAFGGKNDLMVVLSLGPQDDVLDGLPALPKNFIARRSIPQLQLLKRCSAFITHGGANSMHESLAHGVPMVVVPMFGDQPINGDAIARCGAGCNFRSPMQSVSSEALQRTMSQLLSPEPGNEYRESARAMAKKLADAGGAAHAATAILQAIRVWEEPTAYPTLLGHSGAELKLGKQVELQVAGGPMPPAHCSV